MPYHHPDLRSAVVVAASRRVRAGGMASLVAREIARDVGVSSGAVYRHFADIDQLRADVSPAARQELAGSMIRARDRSDEGSDGRRGL